MYRIMMISDDIIDYSSLYENYEDAKKLYEAYLRVNEEAKIYLLELKVNYKLQYYKILKTNV